MKYVPVSQLDFQDIDGNTVILIDGKVYLMCDDEVTRVNLITFEKERFAIFTDGSEFRTEMFPENGWWELTTETTFRFGMSGEELFYEIERVFRGTLPPKEIALDLSFHVDIESARILSEMARGQGNIQVVISGETPARTSFVIVKGMVSKMPNYFKRALARHVTMPMYARADRQLTKSELLELLNADHNL